MEKASHEEIKRVYLPKWIFGMICVMILPMLVFFNYIYFTNPQSKQELGSIGWVALNLVFIVVIVMTYLMYFRKLPSYIIEQEEIE